MITKVNEFRQYLKENKITLQQDAHDKIKITLDEDIILKHAKKMFKNIKTIKDVKGLGTSDYDKLIKQLSTIPVGKSVNEGTGNTTIRFEGEKYPTYYIEYYSSEDEDEDGNPTTNNYVNDTFHDDVIGNLLHNDCNLNLREVNPVKWIGNDQAVYLENDVLRIVFADNEWSMAVGTIPVMTYNEEDEEVVPENFLAESKRVFECLLGMYELHKANGAWLSSKVDSIEL